MIYINRMCAWAVRFSMACVCVAMLGCGGGGGGGSSSGQAAAVPAGTVTEFVVTGVTISSPKHLAFLPSGTDLFVANQARNEILRIDANGQGSVFSTLTSPLGLAFYSAGGADPNTTLFAAATFNAGTGIGLATQMSNPLKITVNGYGIAFTSTKVYVADTSNAKLVTRDVPAWNNATDIALGGTPVGVVYDGSDNIYVSLQGSPGTIKRYQISTGTLSPALNLGTVNLPFPNALALDASGNLYVINKGDVNGNNGTLVKIANPTGVPAASELVGAGAGLCGGAGMAYRDGYLYVSNGTCTAEPNGKPNAILKIKT
jgi:hypothetical protein